MFSHTTCFILYNNIIPARRVRIPLWVILLQKQKTTSFEVVFDGGERGIRTLGACYRTPAFQASTFDHSDISPCSTA